MPVSNFYRKPARTALSVLRSVPVWGRALNVRAKGGESPLVLFLPATGPEQSALLRIYNIARALRPLGWRTLVVPPQLTLVQRRRLIAALVPDVIVMQGARHALNRPALYSGVPVVYDMDDADFHLPHLAEPVRRAMPEVATVMAGSRYLAEWCRMAGAGTVQVVWTGTPVSDRPRPPQHNRPPVIAWAQTRPMTYTREAAMVLEVMRSLAAIRPGLRLRLYDRRPGDDMAFLNPFQDAGITVEWRKSSGYSDYLASFDDVAIGLAPLCLDTPFSRGKSFGKVLAYLDARVPVIGSAVGEHESFFTPETGVITNDLDRWVSEADRLLGDAVARTAQAEAAHDAFRRQLSVEAAAQSVDGALRSVLADSAMQPVTGSLASA